MNEAVQERRIRLTSGEMANLWTSYMNDSLSVCTLSYFLAHAQDPQIRSVLQYAYDLSAKHVRRVAHLLTEEECPVPQGFTDKDVDLNAPRLYSDTFFLLYIGNMGKFGLTAYSFALATSSRADIRAYYSECMASATELFNRSLESLLEKGLHLRSPEIPKPRQVEFVHDQNFLGNFLNIGRERPLLGQEISNLTYNIERNLLGKPLIMGFSQTARDKEVRRYFERGRDMAQKHVEVFGSFLKREHLPVPATWDTEVTDATTPPFSDKLMTYHITVLIASAWGQYGSSTSVSPRADLATAYSRLSLEIANYADDGANLMIKNGWLEKPPQAVDQVALAKA
ncbi:DUF3231 family protein [Paenibacillus sp.]|uniref:DUF3231 family protein n=1 Tax=Paenibacillus sp. TaxID=58172 RepID=UPI0028120832|nr:DUF3231 family protein [Paenibacillus sp.]